MYKIIIKLKFLINYYYLKPQERSQSTLWSYDTNVDITAVPVCYFYHFSTSSCDVYSPAE